MKNTTLFLLLFLGFSSACFGQISIKGSDTMLPFVKELATIYKERYHHQINVSGGGSVIGIDGLKDGSTQIAMCSRDLSDSEKSDLGAVKKIIIAYDALSIILHPSNQVEKLTRKQLEQIFSGEISNWKTLGGKDINIKVFTRDNQSGTFGFMKNIVMNGKEMRKDPQILASNAGIVQGVSGNQGAIGYVGLAHVEEVVKTVAISFDGKNFVKPTFKSALEKSYPIVRPLYFFYNVADASSLRKFTNFILSDAGQKIASYKGYIPVIL
jgi:phosphate transport system substrate-binding protein